MFEHLNILKDKHQQLKECENVGNLAKELFQASPPTLSM
jgi:hypothetical protein